jgi:hypothetical protein
MKSGFYLSPCGEHIIEIRIVEKYFDDYIVDLWFSWTEKLRSFDYNLKVLLCCWIYLWD